MRLVSFIFLSLLCLSCQKKESAFEARLYLDLLTSFEVERVESDLSGPPATWQNVLRFRAFDEKLSLERVFCLNYQVPFEKMKIAGELRFERLNAHEKCHPGSEKNLVTEFKEITKMSYFLFDADQTLKEEQKELKAFVLYLHVEMKGKELWMEFPLLNLEGGHILEPGEKFKGHQFEKTRYGSSRIKRYFPGVQFLPLETRGENLPAATNSDSLAQSYQDKNLVPCHDMKLNCEETQAFSCEECRYGWFEVAGARCKGGYKKFCGVRRCGGLGEVACPRGTEFSQLSNLCFEGSNAGFCAQGLHTYCDESGILICK